MAARNPVPFIDCLNRCSGYIFLLMMQPRRQSCLFIQTTSSPATPYYYQPSLKYQNINQKERNTSLCRLSVYELKPYLFLPQELNGSQFVDRKKTLFNQGPSPI